MNAVSDVPQPQPAVVDALARLGKQRLSLAIHDSCFPAAADEDIGRGSPYSSGALAFLAFARRLGFDAVQFGPQGQTARDNPSPYDGTLFSRNILNLDLASLQQAGHDGAGAGWLGTETLERLVAGRPPGDRQLSQHAYAYDACQLALDEIYRRFVKHRAGGEPASLALARQLDRFVAGNQAWLQDDALYFALAAAHAGRHQRDWPNPPDGRHGRGVHRRHGSRYAAAIERYQLGQCLVHQQHLQLRRTLQHWRMHSYGDMQVGLSPCDAWSRGELFLRTYAMGAPPSRTNPAGQPWGYGVLDPDLYHDPAGQPGPALSLLWARVNKLLDEFDGLRIDHPHGLVCPWVYRTDQADPGLAVRQGARLFSSPDLADHPALSRYAIVREDQLDRSVPRYADDWVRSLDEAQLARYAALFDAILDAVHQRGGSVADVLCEVLSTQPYPLARVIARHGLGRFRVTQKANLQDPGDVYRSENARAEDWIMVGNHDTPSLWRLVDQWRADDRARQQAEYLAWKLVPARERAAFAREIAADPRKLAHAKVADLFASPAEQVMIFFVDLLGMHEDYNRPGQAHPDNWTLRVPQDYAARYGQAAARGEALNLPCVLALALRARGDPSTDIDASLIRRLQVLAGWWPDTAG